MQSRHRNTFTTIRTEGAILPPDLLLKISEGDKNLKGLLPTDYHLLQNEKLNEAINRSWNRLFGAWENYQTAKGKVKADQAGTTETRERWLLPLFQELGFGRLQTSTALTLNGKSYPISHFWGRAPIHLLGFNIALDKRTPGIAGAAQTSPYSMLQEFLNRSDDHLWGFLSNGNYLRILRDNVSLTRQAYVEFDLQGMMEGEVYADFVLLWMLCHQSRVEGEKPEQFWLEQWSRAAQEQGTRALDQLRDGVEDAISALGTGFLLHPANQVLRRKLRDGSLNIQDYYRQLLRLVYRLIILFVAEDRDLLFPPDTDLATQQRYKEYYSTQRLRRLAERSRGSRHADLYHTLRLVMEKLGSIDGCDELALPALGGFLFSEAATPDLTEAELPNQNLLDAVRALAYTVDNRTLRSVDYKNLGPEELGSVYESLLELHPEINVDAGTFTLSSASGHERKTTGSYYTPASLIQVLLDSALDPVIEDRLGAVNGRTIQEQEQALLNIKVCDPASGSGHFLIAASHRLAKRLASVRTGTEEPAPEATRTALRDVISHCIYGVDVNPMAVELCKVSLWMEALEPGKPLSFLDAHIKCGNSLIGVGSGMDIDEIPDDAFKPAFGDDRATATALRKRNKREREGQLGFRWDVTLIKDHRDLDRWVARQSQKLETMPENQAVQILDKEAAYHALLATDHYQRQRLEYDLWTAAFFWPIPKGDAETMQTPTQQELLHLRRGEDLDTELVRRVLEDAENHLFFHWEFEFPTVFARAEPGFDVVIGNPPWERIKLQEPEFFIGLDPVIAKAPNKAARSKLINQLPKDNPDLWQLYEKAKAEAENTSYFVRNSNRFPLTATGDINTYALFAGLVRSIVSHNGRTGIIVPTGIATDSTTQKYFSDLIDKHSLVSLFDFENREKLFSSVDSRTRFCLITISAHKVLETKFAFYITNVSQLSDQLRSFSLSIEDVSLFNPNTKTLPVFRTSIDAVLARKLYLNSTVLVNELIGKNPWEVNFVRLFHMSNDSYLFVDAPSSDFLPLLESKMIAAYDHRFANVIFNPNNRVRPGQPEPTSVNDHQNPYFSAKSQWFIPAKAVLDLFDGQLPRWYLVYKRIVGATNERTLSATILPTSGASDSFASFSSTKEPKLLSCLIANLNSLVLDYVVRLKISTTSINHFVMKQLPFIEPSKFKSKDKDFISSRILELIYTAWDMEPFAQDVGYDGPPFRWDEERRAILRAELDAYYARLYGLDRDELRYILDPQDVYGPDFPGETFRVLKEKEIKKFGEYRTKLLVLAAWDRMQEAIDNGTEYVPMVDPPPANPSVSNPNRDGRGYEDPGLVMDNESVIETESIPSQPEGEKKSTREEETISAEPKVEKTVVGVKSTQTSDYSLYKCRGCGQMVMGFDKEEHICTLHGGEEQEFVRL